MTPKLTDDELRAMYTPIAQQRPASRAYCASEEALLAVVRREGSEEERLAVLDHVMVCGPCQEDLNLLRAVEAAGQRLMTDRVRTRSPRDRTWVLSITALAASIAIIVGIQTNRRIQTRNQEAMVRGGGSTVTLVAPAPGTTVDPNAPTVFIWNAVPRVMDYQLEVLDSSGRVIYSQVTTDTTMTVPRITARLDSTVMYHWCVLAKMMSGEERTSLLPQIRFAPSR